MPCIAPGPVAVFAKQAQPTGHKQLHEAEIRPVDGLRNRRSHGVPHHSHNPRRRPSGMVVGGCTAAAVGDPAEDAGGGRPSGCPARELGLNDGWLIHTACHGITPASVTRTLEQRLPRQPGVKINMAVLVVRDAHR